MLGKNGLHIRIQHEKLYQNDELFFLGSEKVLKMQAGVMYGHLYSKKYHYRRVVHRLQERRILWIRTPLLINP